MVPPPFFMVAGTDAPSKATALVTQFVSIRSVSVAVQSVARCLEGTDQVYSGHLFSASYCIE